MNAMREAIQSEASVVSFSAKEPSGCRIVGDEFVNRSPSRYFPLGHMCLTKKKS
jgi:hypothetical protein